MPYYLSPKVRAGASGDCYLGSAANYWQDLSNFVGKLSGFGVAFPCGASDHIHYSFV